MICLDVVATVCRMEIGQVQNETGELDVIRSWAIRQTPIRPSRPSIIMLIYANYQPVTCHTADHVA